MLPLRLLFIFIIHPPMATSRPVGHQSCPIQHFDTLHTARRLNAVGIKAEHADAILDAMGQSANQLVTVEHFNAGLSMMQSRIDAIQTEVTSRVDANRAEMRAELTFLYLIWAGIIIVINGVAMTGFGIFLTRGAGM